MERNTDITSAHIVDAAYQIHRDLGPGLLESVYERLLANTLTGRGLVVERQREVSFEYDGVRYEGGLFVDLVVNDCVAVEIKAVERTLPVHRRQTFTYLRLLDFEVGLLLNFGAALMKEGIVRIVNGYRPTAASRMKNRSGQLPPGTASFSREGAKDAKGPPETC